jgi:hypothetical protein
MLTDDGGFCGPTSYDCDWRNNVHCNRAVEYHQCAQARDPGLWVEGAIRGAQNTVMVSLVVKTTAKALERK